MSADIGLIRSQTSSDAFPVPFLSASHVPPLFPTHPFPYLSSRLVPYPNVTLFTSTLFLLQTFPPSSPFYSLLLPQHTIPFGSLLLPRLFSKTPRFPLSPPNLFRGGDAREASERGPGLHREERQCYQCGEEGESAVRERNLAERGKQRREGREMKRRRRREMTEGTGREGREEK